MSTSFVMRGYKGKTVASSMSAKPLDIKGTFHMQGHQSVDNAPKWVVDALEENPDIQHIAIVGDKYGSQVYARGSGWEDEPHSLEHPKESVQRD